MGLYMMNYMPGGAGKMILDFVDNLSNWLPRYHKETSFHVRWSGIKTNRCLISSKRLTAKLGEAFCGNLINIGMRTSKRVV